MTITNITITGTYRTPEGAPCRGRLTFTPSSFFVDTEDVLVIAPIKQIASVNALGQFSIDLPISDDVDANPLDFTWKVREELNASGFRSNRTYSIRLSTDMLPAVDIADLLVVPATAGEVSLIKGPKGDTGDTGPTGPTGPQGPTLPYMENNLVGLVDNGFIIPSRASNGARGTNVAGQIFMTPFIAPTNLTVNYLGVFSSDGASGAVVSGATLSKIGLYQKDAVGNDWTLIASTASDTSIFTATNTYYKLPTTASVPITAGTLYGLAFLRVGGTGGGNIVLLATAPGAGSAVMLQQTPALSYANTGKTDLPASYTSPTSNANVMIGTVTSA